MSAARLKHYGWGREGEGMTAAEQAFVLGRYRAKFSRDSFETLAVPRLEEIALRAPRVPPSRWMWCCLHPSVCSHSSRRVPPQASPTGWR